MLSEKLKDSKILLPNCIFFSYYMILFMIVNVLNSVDPLNYKYLCINMDMPKPQGMIYQTCILGCQLTEREDNAIKINLQP